MVHQRGVKIPKMHGGSQTEVSDGYSNTRTFEDLYIVGEGSAMPSSLSSSMIVWTLCCRQTLRNCTESTQSGTVGVVSAFIGFDDDFESIRLHGT